MKDPTCHPKIDRECVLVLKYRRSNEVPIHTDNTLEISHLSAHIYIDNNIYVCEVDYLILFEFCRMQKKN